MRTKTWGPILCMHRGQISNKIQLILYRQKAKVARMIP